MEKLFEMFVTFMMKMEELEKYKKEIAIGFAVIAACLLVFLFFRAMDMMKAIGQ